MERVGDGGNNTNVDVADSVVNEFKEGGNRDGYDQTGIGIISHQGKDTAAPVIGTTSTTIIVPTNG